MIENSNASKNPASGDFVDIPKYIGVASVNVKAINPSNATLHNFGWNIPEDADEPKYIRTEEKDGKLETFGRVRFLVQIQDLEDKPMVAMDFFIRPGLTIDKTGTKCKIIDAYGRSAWGTKAEVSNRKIPQYSDGPADISQDYKACHPGQEEIVKFLFKYLNVTPLKAFNKDKNEWVPTKNPGKLTVDNWDAICSGNVDELIEYIGMQPDNRVKVIFGIKTDENNHAYQTFLNTVYIGNGAKPDLATGEYTSARKAIDKFNEGKTNNPYTFSASQVRKYVENATEVTDNADKFLDGTVEDNPYDDLPF